MSQENFNTGIISMDKLSLERIIKETTSATDRNGRNYIYQIPLHRDYVDLCQFLFARNGVKMEKYQSSLNPEYPLLRISFQDIRTLTKEQSDFLFSVNVKIPEIKKHLQNVLLEMRAHQK